MYRVFLYFQAQPTGAKLERERRTCPFSSYSETTWFLLCKQKKLVNSTRLEAVPSPSGRICVTVQGTALGWGAARGISPDPATFVPLFHHNKHQINSNWYRFYTVLEIRGGCHSGEYLPLACRTLFDYNVTVSRTFLFYFGLCCGLIFFPRRFYFQPVDSHTILLSAGASVPFRN